MGRSKFPIPENVQEIIAILNLKDWELSVVDKEGYVYILDGDQVHFIADTIQEVKAFLSGAFLATYCGQSLDDILGGR